MFRSNVGSLLEDRMNLGTFTSIIGISMDLASTYIGLLLGLSEINIIPIYYLFIGNIIILFSLFIVDHQMSINKDQFNKLYYMFILLFIIVGFWRFYCFILNTQVISMVILG